MRLIPIFTVSQSVTGRENYFSQEVSSIMMSRFISGKRNKSDEIKPAVSLTKREGEILKLVAEEMTNVEIGRKLKISPRTVDTHRRNLLQKLDVKNTAGLVKYAFQHDLI